MDRANEYESAFEDYLRDRALPYVAVDETRRATLGDGPVKSLDFIVYGLRGCRLLVDVKGRKFPGGSAAKPKMTWECWSTRADVEGLGKWAEVFGPAYEPAFVFMYKLGPTVTIAADTPDLFEWRESRYLLRAALVADYKERMKVRSPKWGTVDLPKAAFAEIVKPFVDITHHRGFMGRRPEPAVVS